MDQIERQLDDLKRLLSTRIDQTSSKASKSMLLSLILMFN